LGGDFNDTLTKKDRQSNATLHKKDPVNNLSILVKVHDLTDIWRFKKTRNETIYLETQKWHIKEQDIPVVST